MEIQLSWNLFIGGFFGIILAYSLIIGKNQTIKIILATYLAAFSADGLGNLGIEYFVKYSPFAKSATPELLENYFLVVKVTLFIGLIVLLVIKSNFIVDIENSGHVILRILSNIIFGILSAGLIICAILVFMSGVSFLDFPEAAEKSGKLVILLQQSRLARLMVYNYNLWFSIPALAFLIDSIISNRKNA